MKKLRTRLLSVLLVACSMLSILPPVSFAVGETGNATGITNAVINIDGTNYPLTQQVDLSIKKTAKFSITINVASGNSTNRELKVTLAKGLQWISYAQPDTGITITAPTEETTGGYGSADYHHKNGTATFQLPAYQSSYQITGIIKADSALYQSKDTIISKVLTLEYADSKTNLQKIEADFKLTGDGIGYHRNISEYSSDGIASNPNEVLCYVNGQGNSQFPPRTLCKSLKVDVTVPTGTNISSVEFANLTATGPMNTVTSTGYTTHTYELNNFYYPNRMIPLKVIASFPKGTVQKDDGSFADYGDDLKLTFGKFEYQFYGMNAPTTVNIASPYTIMLKNPNTTNFRLTSKTLYEMNWTREGNASNDFAGYQTMLGCARIWNLGTSNDATDGYTYAVDATSASDLEIYGISIPCSPGVGYLPTEIKVVADDGLEYEVPSNKIAGLKRSTYGVLATTADFKYIPSDAPMPSGATIQKVTATIPKYAANYVSGRISQDSYRGSGYSSDFSGSAIFGRMKPSFSGNTSVDVSFQVGSNTPLTGEMELQEASVTNLQVTVGDNSTQQFHLNAGETIPINAVVRNYGGWISCSGMTVDPEVYLFFPRGTALSGNVTVLDQNDQPVTVEVTQHTTSISAAKQSDGWTCYKITLPQGYILGTTGDPTFTSQKQLKISYNMRARLSSPSASYSTAQLIQARSACGEYGSWANAINDAYKINGNKPIASGYQNAMLLLNAFQGVSLEAGIKLDSEDDYYYYVPGDPNTQAVFTPQAVGDLNLKISNGKDANINNLSIYIPIPKKGQNIASAFQDDTYQFDTKAEVISADGYTVRYGKIAAGTYDYENMPTITDLNTTYFGDANIIWLTKSTLASDQTDTISIKVTADTNDTDDLKNIFRVWYYFEDGAAKYAPPVGTAVCTLLQNATLRGVAYLDVDRDGNYTSGTDTTLKNVPIVVTEVESDGSAGRTYSAQTDAFGVYEINGLPKNKDIQASFKSDYSTNPSDPLARRYYDTTAASGSISLTAENTGKWLNSSTFQIGSQGTGGILADLNAGMVEPFTVTFDAMNNNATVVPSSVKRFAGEKLNDYSFAVSVFPDPGKVFSDGWKKNGVGDISTSDLATEVITDDVTYTATLKSTNSNIQFFEWDATNGYSLRETVTAAYNEKIVPTNFTPELTAVSDAQMQTLNLGYTFKGWKKDGIGATVSLNDILDETFTFNANYYAVYEKTGGITVTLDPNHDGKLPKLHNGLTYGEVVDTTGFNRPGFTLVGWSENQNAATTDSNVYPVVLCPASATTYYAVWSADDINVTFVNPRNGTTAVTYPRNDGLNASNFPPIADTDFEGWSDGTDTKSATQWASVHTNLTKDLIFVAKYKDALATVVFDYNRGESTAANTIIGKKGDPFNAPTVTRTGYTFAQWTTTTAGASPINESGVGTFGDANTITIYQAQWKPEVNTVHFAAPNATVEFPTAPVNSGDAITAGNIPTVTANAGYTFQDQWTCSLGGVYTTKEVEAFIVEGYAPGIILMFTAVVVPNGIAATDRSLTFEMNGGLDAGYTLYLTKDSTVDVSHVTATPSSSTDEFVGWTTAKDDNTTLVTTVTMDANKTIYALYQTKTPPANHAVTFATGANGVFTNPGDTSITQTVTTGNTIPAVPDITANTDYTFVGWQVDGTGSIFTTDAVKLIPVKTNVNYVAAYVKTGGDISYTLKFHANGGPSAPSAVTLPKNSELDLTYMTAEAPTGKEFVGWYDAAIGGTQVTSYKFTKDGEVFAQYESIPSYTVTFDADTDGTISPAAHTETVERGHAVAIVPMVTPNPGMIFVGWLCDADNGVYSGAAVASYAVSADVTFTAQYASDTDASVLFDFAGGEVGGVGSVLLTGATGTPYTIPTNPSKTGYSFTSWSTSPSGTFGLAGALDIITAQWQKDSYTVNFESSDIAKGTVSASKIVEYGDTIPSVPPVTILNADYVLGGWQINGSGKIYTTEAIEQMPITKNIDFMAFFKASATANPTTYTLTLNPAPGTLTVPTSLTLPAGVMVDVAAFVPTPASGSIFLGWKDEGGNPATSMLMDRNHTLTAQYASTTPGGPFTVSFDAGLNGTMNPASHTETVAAGKTVTNVPKITADSKYTFLGWSMNGGSTYYSSADVKSMAMTGHASFVAQYQKTNVNGGVSGGISSGGTTTYYALTFETNGGKAIAAVTQEAGTKVSLATYTPTRAGYQFTGWYSDADFKTKVEAVTLSGNMTVYAKWGENLIVDHIAYMHGYADGSFRPDYNMTRAEAAQLIYNLLENKQADGNKSFNDVGSDAWFHEAVTVLSSKGIIKGYTDGSFKPDAKITRAEFVAMIARFAAATAGGKTFMDVSESHWAYRYISTASQKGWVDGYPDGSFKPDANITRAQAAKTTNALLGRTADKAYIDQNNVNNFNDITSSHWGYYDVMEATYAHDHETTADGQETWK